MEPYLNLIDLCALQYNDLEGLLFIYSKAVGPLCSEVMERKTYYLSAIKSIYDRIFLHKSNTLTAF